MAARRARPAATAGRPRAPTTSTRAGTSARPAHRPTAATTTATSSTASATSSRSIPTTRPSPSRSARRWAASRTRAPPSASPWSGKPLAVYMGDDSRGEYIYKFVSTATWDAADATAGQPHRHRRQVPRRRQALCRQVQRRRQRPVDRAAHRQRRRSPATRPTPSPTRPTCWSTPAWPPTRSARPRWTAPSGAPCTRRPARSTSR